MAQPGLAQPDMRLISGFTDQELLREEPPPVMHITFDLSCDAVNESAAIALTRMNGKAVIRSLAARLTPSAESVDQFVDQFCDDIAATPWFSSTRTVIYIDSPSQMEIARLVTRLVKRPRTQ